MTSLVSNMMDDSDVETTDSSEPLGLLPYRFEPTSPTPLARVIVTANCQPFLLQHVSVLITVRNGVFPEN